MEERAQDVEDPPLASLPGREGASVAHVKLPEAAFRAFLTYVSTSGFWWHCYPTARGVDILLTWWRVRQTKPMDHPFLGDLLARCEFDRLVLVYILSRLPYTYCSITGH